MTVGARAASASEGGLVSLTSVLASLYPLVTVMLAAIILHERLARAGWRVGIITNETSLAEATGLFGLLIALIASHPFVVEAR